MVHSAGKLADANARLNAGRNVVQRAADALARIGAALDESFSSAVEQILQCRGSVLVIGMGKAGLVGQKVSATLASTGTRSHFIHPSEAIHGDLGRIGQDDLVIMLSHSGTTEEIIRILPHLKRLGVVVVAITATPQSPLGEQATITLPLGKLEEAGNLQLAPSTSTTAMMALGDALALVVSEARDFQAEDFARFHPGGNLGRKLSRVEDVMRPLKDCRIGTTDETVRDVLIRVGQPGRRTGAIMLVDSQGVLRGVFTDSDLARLFEFRRDDRIDGPIEAVMTKHPVTVVAGSFLSEALQIMSDVRISELPVVDADGRPCGLIDITDVLETPEPATIRPQECDSTGNEDAPVDRLYDGPATIPFVNPNTQNGDTE